MESHEHGVVRQRGRGTSDTPRALNSTMDKQDNMREVTEKGTWDRTNWCVCVWGTSRMQPDRQLGQPVSALLKIFTITSKTTGSQLDPRRTRLTFPIRKTLRTGQRRREGRRCESRTKKTRPLPRSRTVTSGRSHSRKGGGAMGPGGQAGRWRHRRRPTQTFGNSCSVVVNEIQLGNHTFWTPRNNAENERRAGATVASKEGRSYRCLEGHFGTWNSSGGNAPRKPFWLLWSAQRNTAHLSGFMLLFRDFRPRTHYCQAADCVYSLRAPGETAWARKGACYCSWCDGETMAMRKKTFRDARSEEWISVRVNHNSNARHQTGRKAQCKSLSSPGPKPCDLACWHPTGATCVCRSIRITTPLPYVGCSPTCTPASSYRRTVACLTCPTWTWRRPTTRTRDKWYAACAE